MKTTTRHSLLRLLSAATVALVGAGAASAQTVNPVPAPTIITSAPYTISAAGYYQLGANLSVNSTSGAIIVINANNVTLDFGGHFISGPVGVGNGATAGIEGVQATGHTNLTIINGTIANCYNGIALRQADNNGGLNYNHLIRNMLITNCSHVGVNFQATTFSRVEDCVISNIGGAAAATGTGNYGIYGLGTGSVFTNNVIEAITGRPGTTNTAYGIDIPVTSTISSTAIMSRNRVFNSYYGIVMDSAASKYQDNLTSNCTAAFSGGTDVGGNN